MKAGHVLRIDTKERSGLFESRGQLRAPSLAWLDLSKTLASFTSLAVCTWFELHMG